MYIIEIITILVATSQVINIMHALFCLLCSDARHIYPYALGLLQWHWDNHTIALLPVK